MFQQEVGQQCEEIRKKWGRNVWVSSISVVGVGGYKQEENQTCEGVSSKWGRRVRL